jgi:hypothetical protein
MGGAQCGTYKQECFHGDGSFKFDNAMLVSLTKITAGVKRTLGPKGLSIG